MLRPIAGKKVAVETGAKKGISLAAWMNLELDTLPKNWGMAPEKSMFFLWGGWLPSAMCVFWNVFGVSPTWKNRNFVTFRRYSRLF